jgi:hypothetical protein
MSRSVLDNLEMWANLYLSRKAWVEDIPGSEDACWDLVERAAEGKNDPLLRLYWFYMYAPRGGHVGPIEQRLNILWAGWLSVEGRCRNTSSLSVTLGGLDHWEAEGVEVMTMLARAHELVECGADGAEEACDS